jgi:hypothetical protein
MAFLVASLIAIGISTVAASTDVTSVAARSLGEVKNRTTTATEVRPSVDINSQIYSYCGADLVGGDQWVERYSNPDSCVTNCLPQTGCNAATWTKYNGGTCYFKRLTGNTKPVNVVPNAGAVSFIRPDSDTPFWLPAFWGDSDMPGNDLANFRDKTGSGCSPECGRNEKCSAFTWSSYEGGTCWLKTKASPYLPSVGSISGIIPSNRNPSSCLPYL